MGIAKSGQTVGLLGRKWVDGWVRVESQIITLEAVGCDLKPSLLSATLLCVWVRLSPSDSQPEPQGRVMLIPFLPKGFTSTDEFQVGWPFAAAGLIYAAARISKKFAEGKLKLDNKRTEKRNALFFDLRNSAASRLIARDEIQHKEIASVISFIFAAMQLILLANIPKISSTVGIITVLFAVYAMQAGMRYLSRMVFLRIVLLRAEVSIELEKELKAVKEEFERLRELAGDSYKEMAEETSAHISRVERKLKTYDYSSAD